MTIKKVLDYAFENQKSFQQDLFKCLEIASISTLSNHHQDILNCSFLVATHLSEIGLSNVKQFENYGNPIIYADNGYDPRKPTVLFYGHYDVQPVDPIELWDAPPFSPIIKDDYIFARGASDNKGMFYSQIKAVESYLKVDGGCPVNIKFVIEGEEEIGSEGLIRFIKDKPDLLSHDVLLVSDSPKFSTDQPSICKSIRGLVYFDVQVKSILSDVHSGQLGGGVPNVIDYVSSCIASMKDPLTNRVLIPGFYDDVDEFKSTKDIPEFQTKLAELSILYGLGEHATSRFFDQLWFLPTLDCNGIISGFVDEGAKTVIPNMAKFKISSRLVSSQSPEKVSKLISSYILNYFPSSFSVTVNLLGPHAKPMNVDIDNIYFKLGIDALKMTHESPILIQGEGGSIPVLAEFQSLYSSPIILIGLNSPNDNIHAPNERFKCSDFMDGIRLYIYYLDLISKNATN